ncbi:MAG: MotA/TolQ/ExbB proton channel family protein [Pseudomonadales bacterium]
MICHANRAGLCARVLALGFLLLAPSGLAATAAQTAEQEATTLDALVQSVRDARSRAKTRLAERERKFIAARDERASLLADARKRRQQAEAEADQLRAAFEAGEETLTELETALEENSGDLRDVFAVVRQVAGDAAPTLRNSLVSAQDDTRNALVERLAAGEANPTASDLRELWLALLDEMNLSGQVARFDAAVISAAGEESTRRVTRVGTFTALADGEYLRYLPDTGRLLALSRQPAGTSVAAALAFEQAELPMSTVSLDPSRGSILALIVQAPKLNERVQQGGVIGYLILLIGAVGLLLGAHRLFVLLLSRRRANAELNNPEASGKYAVAALRGVAADPTYQTEPDALSAKLDEVVAGEAERLNRGLPTLATIAAVSPLLGLLGTVTGMIETFQVITLFGAGDPRLMSGGISQALITTQLGLAVAIPLLLIHSFLQGRANTLITRLDQKATDLFATQRSAA